MLDVLWLAFVLFDRVREYVEIRKGEEMILTGINLLKLLTLKSAKLQANILLKSDPLPKKGLLYFINCSCISQRNMSCCNSKSLSSYPIWENIIKAMAE